MDPPILAVKDCSQQLVMSSHMHVTHMHVTLVSHKLRVQDTTAAVSVLMPTACRLQLSLFHGYPDINSIKCGLHLQQLTS